MSQALDMVRDGGRVVVCGHYTDNGAVEIHPHWQINRKHVEIKGCWGSRYDHFHRAVALTAKYGDLKPWREMVSGRYDLDARRRGARGGRESHGDQGDHHAEPQSAGVSRPVHPVNTLPLSVRNTPSYA